VSLVGETRQVLRPAEAAVHDACRLIPGIVAGHAPVPVMRESGDGRELEVTVLAAS